MLDVRVARVDEVDAVLAFYAQMIDEMEGTDFDVLWRHGVHPSDEFLRASVAAGQVHVGMVDAGDGAGERIACAMVMNGEGAEGYERVPWPVQAAPGEVWVLHVVATLPEFHGRGFARALQEAGIEAARAAGKRALRLDTFTFNARARSLYERCGYVYVGTYPMFYDDLGTIDAAMYERPL